MLYPVSKSIVPRALPPYAEKATKHEKSKKLTQRTCSCYKDPFNTLVRGPSRSPSRLRGDNLRYYIYTFSSVRVFGGRLPGIGIFQLLALMLASHTTEAD